MLPKSADTQFHTPTMRGAAAVPQNTRPAAQAGDPISTRLQLKELFNDQANSAKIVIDTNEVVASADNFSQPARVQMTFSDIEPFLTHVGNWLDFDRKEVENNGFISR